MRTHAVIGLLAAFLMGIITATVFWLYLSRLASAQYLVQEFAVLQSQLSIEANQLAQGGDFLAAEQRLNGELGMIAIRKRGAASPVWPMDFPISRALSDTMSPTEQVSLEKQSGAVLARLAIVVERQGRSEEALALLRRSAALLGVDEGRAREVGASSLKSN